MREKLNSNPLAQVAVIGFLLLATGFFVMSTMGGGKEEEAESTAPAAAPEGSALEGVAVTPTGEAGLAAPAEVPALPPEAAEAAPPLPGAVTDAFAADRTVVLLFVDEGGIDDRLVEGSVDRLAALPDVATFVVPADQISRYAAVAQGVAVDRVPALVVVRPKHLNRDVPAASVQYGFQSPESVVQAVIDAGYKGRTLPYHP
jgi:hypothetical protein